MVPARTITILIVSVHLAISEPPATEDQNFKNTAVDGISSIISSELINAGIHNGIDTTNVEAIQQVVKTTIDVAFEQTDKLLDDEIRLKVNLDELKGEIEKKSVDKFEKAISGKKKTRSKAGAIIKGTEAVIKGIDKLTKSKLGDAIKTKALEEASKKIVEGVTNFVGGLFRKIF